MLVKYIGPHPEVVVDEFDQEQVIVNGEPVDVPDELAVRLLQQDTWALGGADAERKREELDKLATAVGIPNPEALPTKEAVVAAVNVGVQDTSPAFRPAPAADAPSEPQQPAVAQSDAPPIGPVNKPPEQTGETSNDGKGEGQ